jgi:ubiquinone/menaquinone biosynthesis C-methylase UbiE
MKKYPELYIYLSNIVKQFATKSVNKPLIVDLGVGTGLLPMEMIRAIPNAKILGVDPSEEMLKKANENIKNNNFEAKIGKAESIPLDSEKADIVVSRFSLAYWNPPEAGFKEIYRILKSGGIIVLEVLNKDIPKQKLYSIKIQMHLKSASNDVIKYHIDAYKTAYSFDEVKGFLLNLNFKVIYSEYTKKDWKFIIVAQK